MVKISYPKSIQTFFEEISIKIKDSLDPDFILIAGSFGKESWLYNKNELISDFEFVFVCKKRWSLKKKKFLLETLNNEYPYDISLKGYLKKNVERKVISNYSLKNPGYLSLDFFDTFSNPNILYNKYNEFLDIDVKTTELPVWEAWRLFINRVGDLMSLLVKDNIPDYLEKYYWLKLFESTADAYCITQKKYESSISSRIKIFNKNLVENDDELKDECKKSFPTIEKALIARANHNLLLFGNDLNRKEYRRFMISWLDYFESKLREQELMLYNDKEEFYDNYSNSRRFQKKYLGFDYRFNIAISNSLLLLFHRSLFNFNFKFYNYNVSWKHIILLTISNLVREYINKSNDYSGSKRVFGKIIRRKYLKNQSNPAFILIAINYWKALR